MPARNTYRYKLKVGDRTVLYGFTIDLQRREREHQRRWPNARVEQVGEPTTHREAGSGRRRRRPQCVPAEVASEPP